MNRENAGNGNHIQVYDAADFQESGHDAYTAQHQANVAAAVRAMLQNLVQDPTRQGLRRTPERVAKMYAELLAGYHTNLNELINGALFDVAYDEMIVVRDISFYSLCEHHLLPFFGLAHVAYIPGKQVIGLSKLPRIVEMYARRLQVQERLTQEIADAITAILDPAGVAVVIEGSHLCAIMRGIKQEQSRMITSAMRGTFKSCEKTRAEFMAHINHGNRLRTAF
ncbi:MAG: GTP cyclohydrolase I FolE [Anaerolineales bacterium]|nr:GTP cyclohydrolase I FolE [Anaerolineales bacterium]MCB8951791.1 GTP cyclohydrolase I FolE [Ardenticatenales bacterium]